MSGPTWNEKFELPDELNSVSDIPDYIKTETFIDNPRIRVCINKIHNRIIFKIKKKHYLQIFNAWNNQITSKH